MTEFAKSKHSEIHGHFAVSIFPVLSSREVELVSTLWSCPAALNARKQEVGGSRLEGQYIGLQKGLPPVGLGGERLSTGALILN